MHDHLFVREFLQRAHERSLFDVAILPGVIATFGEPRSKWKSGRYKLAKLCLSGSTYSEEDARCFWSRFYVQYVSHTQGRNRKLPYVHRVFGSPSRLIRGGYIAITEPNMPDRATFRLQNSYEFWAERFYFDGGASPNVLETQRRAAAALLNKINAEPHILRDIPTRSDWRVFECIVAEVFRQFGYDVELTAKTRDGGRDIIALSKPGEPQERLLIECKHWKNKVDVKAVRCLVGVAVAEDKNNPTLPTGIILATTSTFTKCAKEYRLHSMIPIELSLRDHGDVLRWIGDYNAIGMTPNEVRGYLQLGSSR